MNLDDTTLLRGWINHLTWPELDAQLADGEVSSRKRLKALRRQLAIKSRFYGKPKQAVLWLGERSNNDAWRNRALRALTTLNSLPDPLPALDHSVNQWFAESLCATLPHTSKTLAELIGLLEASFAGDAELPETVQAKSKRLVAFFDEHAVHLGYQLNKKPKSTALPVPLSNVAPLERVLIPLALNGEQGSNRSPEPCRIQAAHDLDAIKSWLSLKDDNAKTYNAYKKELERLLLWAVLERNKALSSLNTDDCKAYIRFLKTLTTADSTWVTLTPANKRYGKWKPFYYRGKKSSQEQIPEPTDIPQLVLSPKSVNYAKTVISSCMEWLVKQSYLKHNNFQDIPAIKFAQTKLQSNNRAFTFRQMHSIFAYAEARAKPDNPDFLAKRRILFMLKFAFSTGLRIHELAAASFGDIECLEDETGEHYFLKVVGKHSIIRQTSLPKVFMEELKAYLRLRGLPTHFDFLPQQAPIIPSLRDKTARKLLTSAGIHKIFSAFFDQMFKDLENDQQADKHLLTKLRNASTHWLRHSYGSYLANDKHVPLTYIRDELGHSNISTTSLYLNTDVKERQKVVSEAFSGI